MFKSHTPFRMLLLSACLLPITHVSADVLSSTTTPNLIEPAGTYGSSTPSLLNMRIKTVIGNGACNADVIDGCTLSDVLNDIDSSDDVTPEIKVKMTADDFPDDGLVSNAELRQRGATSRRAPQKSFRIKLDSSDDLWRGERRIQLVKSFWDFSRIRNKLSYDLFKDIPNLPSMRTQFVNFKIEDQGFVEDYGLYTHVENFGKEYLVRRNWDKDSGVYKAENFFFKDNAAFALNAAGEPLDEDAFEKLMEIKRGDDHSKFVEMVKAVDNPGLDFNSQVFNKYFNQDNYLSWFAMNILMDNYDTNFHNFYLYNPKDTEKFYFVPWDYDLALGAAFDTDAGGRVNLARWTQSHANFWGQELHQRFLRQPGNLGLLREAMEEIKDKYLTRSKLQQKADSYYNIVFPFVSSSPDIDNLYLGGTNPEKIAGYNRVFSSLASKVEQNYNLFVAKIGDPMPFTLDDPELINNDSYNFSWAPSESLMGQTIRYDLEISSKATFDAGSVVFRRNQIQSNSVTIPWNYASGDYFYRVTARDVNAPSQFWQVGYNQVNLNDGRAVYGVVAFNASVNNGGSAPVGNPDTSTTGRNVAKTIDVLANDSGSGLYIESSNPWSEKGGSVSIVNNQINYKPKTDFTGTDRLWYTLKDSQGRTSFSGVTIEVSGASAGPVGNPDSTSTSVNTSKTIDVLANDTGAGLTISNANPWSERGGNVAIVNNKINYSPKNAFTGTDRLWYTLRDNQGRTNFSVVSISVSGGDTAYPIANPDNASTSLSTTTSINVLGNDTGAGLYLSSTSPYSLKGGIVTITNNRIVYKPKSGFTGEDKLWYVMKDSQGRANSAGVTINVTGTAAYPIANTDNITTTVNTRRTFNALTNDTGGGLRIVEVNGYSRNGGRIVIVDGRLRYTPKSGYRGADSFWYVINDSLGRSNSAKVNVTVN